MKKIKNAVLLLGICTAVSGIFYIVRCYGMAYTDKDVLSRWDLNLYAFFMVLLVLGAGPKWLDFPIILRIIWENAVSVSMYYISRYF